MSLSGNGILFSKFSFYVLEKPTCSHTMWSYCNFLGNSEVPAILNNFFIPAGPNFGSFLVPPYDKCPQSPFRILRFLHYLCLPIFIEQALTKFWKLSFVVSSLHSMTKCQIHMKKFISQSKKSLPFRWITCHQSNFYMKTFWMQKLSGFWQCSIAASFL